MPDSSARFRPIAAVFVGGSVGTGIRAGIGLVVPSLDAVPVATIAINVVGAFALGLLLAVLAARGPDRGARRSVRLLLGTGLLGGFTTFSALATDTAVLLGHGRALEGIVYAAGTVLAGILAAAAGERLGRHP